MKEKIYIKLTLFITKKIEGFLYSSLFNENFLRKGGEKD
jgi:hypothetical protein